MDRTKVFALAVLFIAAAVLASGVYFTTQTPGENDHVSEVTEAETENQTASTAGDGIGWRDADECPTEERYVNKQGIPREWMEESGNVDIDDPDTGTYEATRYPRCEPTDEHLEEAWRLYNESFQEAVEHGWFEFENAVDDGFEHEPTPRHYGNLEHFFDGEQLDPHRPESLVYYEHPEEEDEMVLAGFMYENIAEEGDQVGGPLTVWHYHPLDGIEGPIEDLIIEETEFGSIDEVFEEMFDGEVTEERKNRTGEMVHVWFIDHPMGPFATRMGVPHDRIEEPERMNRSEFEENALEGYRKHYERD